MLLGFAAMAGEIEVLVVSPNPQTRDELGAYLRAAGLSAKGAPDLATALAVPGSPGSVVLFPDELDADEARKAIREILSARPSTRLVVVTAAAGSLAVQDAGERITILPRPAFGWHILDALRAKGPR